MAAESVNYQCPACMGPLHYVGDTGKLQCDYCGSSYTPEEVEALYAEKQKAADAAQAEATARAEAGERSAFEQMGDASGASSVVTQEVLDDAAAVSGQAAAAGGAEASYFARASWNESERAGLRSFTCSSCGAQVTVDATTEVTECPYCGNQAVAPGAFSGGARPDALIPFKLDQEAAKSALSAYYKGKKFLPKEFASQNHIAHLQGVYVPFWLYDGTAEGSGTFHCENVRSYRSGDEEVTETDVYEAYRAGSLSFSRIPADASSKMPDAHMDAIEPFDFSELVDFSVAYLPGYLAERYDEDAEACCHRADRRMRGSLEEELRATVTGYDSVGEGSIDANTQVGEVRQALFPVWMLHTRWKDDDYLFAMNGQTGRLVGDLPVSAIKVILWFLGIFAVLAAVFVGLDVSVFQFDDEATSIIIDGGIPLVAAGFTCYGFYRQMKTAVERDDAAGYITQEGLNLTGSADRYVTTLVTRTRIADSKDD